MSDLIAASMFNVAKYESGEVFHRATHDTLTDLHNRALFFDHLHRRVVQSRRTSEQFGVLMRDMDRLKINSDIGQETLLLRNSRHE